MGKTPEYTKRAAKKYRDKFDIIQLRLEKGMKERIKKISDGQSVNDYIAQAVTEILLNDEETYETRKAHQALLVDRDHKK